MTWELLPYELKDPLFELADPDELEVELAVELEVVLEVDPDAWTEPEDDELNCWLHPFNVERTNPEEHLTHLKSEVNVSQFDGIFEFRPNNWSKYMTPLLLISKVTTFEFEKLFEACWFDVTIIFVDLLFCADCDWTDETPVVVPWTIDPWLCQLVEELELELCWLSWLCWIFVCCTRRLSTQIVLTMVNPELHL